jgi:hypothetical protein
MLQVIDVFEGLSKQHHKQGYNSYFRDKMSICTRHRSEGYSLTSSFGGLGSIQDQVMSYTKWHRGRFSSSTSVTPTNHSTDCASIIIHHKGLLH